MAEIITNPVKKYQTRHLFLLVGTNPLPNYVAGKLLLDRTEDEEDPYHVYFVHTDKTIKIAERLRKKLNLPVVNYQYIIVKEAKPEDIQTEVEKALPEHTTSIGLNFTGGTKAMAVHAYQAVIKKVPDAVRTYLDARTLSIVIERFGEPQLSIPVHGKPITTLEDLLDLHNYQFKIEKKQIKKPLLTPPHKKITNAIASMGLVHIKKWCEENLDPVRNKYAEIRKHPPEIGKNKWEKEQKQLQNKETAILPLPVGNNYSTILNYFCGALTIKELAIAWNEKQGEVVKYLNGGWLEEYVLSCIIDLEKDCKLDSYGMNALIQSVETIKYTERNGKETDTKERVTFEFDDFAIKGYQFFGISCGTGAGKGHLKLKLFEAFVRATQMGGDEAKFALVCGDPNPQKIQADLEEEWNAKGKIMVWGIEDLPDLSNLLRQWFNG